MTDKYKRLWTLTDYQSFLKHPDPIIRNWATYCIAEQYPEQAADSFVDLLTDSDRHLQIRAIDAIEESGDPRFEPALLAVWPGQPGPVRNWLSLALGRLSISVVLPELLAEVETAPDQLWLADEEGDMQWLPVHSAVQALGYYPDEPARNAVWRLIERYPVEDRLMVLAFESLLRFIKPDEFVPLVQRWDGLEPGRHQWWQIFRVLGRTANLEGLVMELIDLLDEEPDEILDFLDFWFLEIIFYSDKFETAFEQAADEAYAGFLPHLLAELERVVKKRGDDPAGWQADWQAGNRPDGYRGRMLYAHQLLTALNTCPPHRPDRYQEAVALGLALLAQVLVDQDDRAALQAAPNEMFRQATLLSILGSTRPNVDGDIVDQVAALGPAIIPHLVEILQEEKVWAWLRTLPAIEKIARQHPGTADAAVPAILDLIDLNQGDEVLEATSKALIAIGPGAVDAIGERLGQDYTYDIFAGGALAHIPTEASVEAWLAYLTDSEAIDDFVLEVLADLGHPAAIPFLRDNLDWQNNAAACTALYKLAVITNRSTVEPEFEHWRSVATQAYQVFHPEHL